MGIASVRGRWFRRWAASLTVTVALLVALTVSGVVAKSPAQGHAQVIAQGVAALPSGNAVWQVTSPIAKANDTQTAQRPLGFVLARSTTILVTGADPDDQSLLDPGEARFVPDGSSDSRAATGGKNALYWNIALVSAANAPLGKVVYQSVPFTPAAGRYDLNLVRDVLKSGVTTAIAQAQGPILVLATSGTVSVKTDDGATKTVQARSAQAFSSGVTITASGGHTATFVAAVIGAQIGGNATVIPVATATPTTTPAATATTGPAATTGSITITTFSCPSTTTSDTLDPSTCTPADQALWFLTRTADGTRVNVDSWQNGVMTWTNLRFGDYLVSFPGNGGGVEWVLQGSNAINHRADGTTTLTVSAAAPKVSANAYEWVTAGASSKSGTGSIQLDFFDCQPGMTVDKFDPSACSPMPPGIGSFTISSPALTKIGPIVSINDAQSLGNGSFVWSDLPFGDYSVSPGNNYTGPALFAPSMDSSAPLTMAGFSLTLDAKSPTWHIAIYRLSTGLIPATPPVGG
jgi:hypothetical protein